MGDETNIAWTDHTFNPWIGCRKVSEGCRNCYAEAMDKRWGQPGSYSVPCILCGGTGKAGVRQ